MEIIYQYGSATNVVLQLTKGNGMSKVKVISNVIEVLCTKERLSKTILSLEKQYEILEINTITNYFGFFAHFQILLKKRK